VVSLTDTVTVRGRRSVGIGLSGYAELGLQVSSKL
jgi:hypothetical protein